MYIKNTGKLTNEGISHLREQSFPGENYGDTPLRIAGEDDADVQRIWNPDSYQELNGLNKKRQRVWREYIVSEEVKFFQEVHPVKVGPVLSNAAPYTDGWFANSSGTKIVIIGREFSNIFPKLVQIQSIPITRASFQIDGTEFGLWTIAKLFEHTLRSRNDAIFMEEYVRSHRHHLGQNISDPLNMVTRADIEPGNLQVSTMTLDQFVSLIGKEISRAERSRRQLLQRNRPHLHQSHKVNGGKWREFLFPNFIGDPMLGPVRACLENPRSDCTLPPPNEGETPAQQATRLGFKKIRSRKPDVVQILLSEQKIEVLDPTMKPLGSIHNFKSAFYAAVLRTLFGQVTPAWSVTALDYRSMRTMEAISGESNPGPRRLGL